jgi:hypothetical protein
LILYLFSVWHLDYYSHHHYSFISAFEQYISRTAITEALTAPY